jgi:hypothetical protein
MAEKEVEPAQEIFIDFPGGPLDRRLCGMLDV